MGSMDSNKANDLSRARHPDFDRDEMEPIAHINREMAKTLVPENPELFNDALSICENALDSALGTRTLTNGELLATHALLSHIHRVQSNVDRRKRFEVERPGAGGFEDTHPMPEGPLG